MQGCAYSGTSTDVLYLISKLIPRKSVMVCNLSATPARYEEQSATIRRSSDLIKRPFQTRAGFKVGRRLSGLQFGINVIQVQPTQNGRGVFRVNQTSLPSNTSTAPTQDMFPAAGQQASWYSQSL
jgi:hypothetical protein